MSHAVVGPAHLCPVCSAHPGPLAAGLALHLLRSALPPSHGSMTVCDAILRSSLLSSSATIKMLSFLSDATPFARLRAAVFRKHRFPRQTVYALIYGRFCGTFFAAPARFFTSAQVFAPSRPAKGSAPFDPRQGRGPCTCPASPFLAKPGFCFSRNFAEVTNVLLFH